MAQLDGQPICESPRSSPIIDREGQPKKSVLTKVKEKAKKLKHSFTLTKKKHSDHDDNSTPSWGVSLEDEDDHEEDSEYLGAPMYESDYAPESYKAKARRLPRAVPEHRVLEDTSDAEPNNSPKAKPKDEQISSLKAIITKYTGQNEPVSDSPRTEAPNNSVFVDATPRKPATPQAGSLTDYLLSKIEPGEEDRTLSRALSGVAANPCASPRAGDSEPSVVEKVREAVVSLLRNDQPRSPLALEKPAVTPKQSAAVIASVPRHSSISAGAREVDEDNTGRILQAN